MSKIFYEDLAQMEVGKCLRLGDTILTKVPEIVKQDSRWFNLSGNQLWIDGKPPASFTSNYLEGIDWNPPICLLVKSWLQTLAAEYSHYCDGEDKEPRWVEKTTPEFHDYLKFFRLTGCKDFMFEAPDGIPFSTSPCGCFIESGYLTDDVAYAFNLFRHWRLSQLNNLQFTGEDHRILGLSFPQKRFPHDMYAKMHASLSSVNMDLSLEQTLAFEIASELHDWALIPLTECLKTIDKLNLDEDLNFRWIYAIHADDWSHFEKKYNSSRHEVAEIIRGKHFLSPAKDIADRSAYMADDAWNLKVLHELTPHLIQMPVYLSKAYELMLSNPEICSVWDCVRLDRRNNFFLVNSEKYGLFSLLRALFFGGLYNNFRFRRRDTVIINTLFNLCYDQTVHPDILRQVDDFDLQSATAEYLKVSTSFINFLAKRKPRIEQFENIREALARERYLIRENKVVFTMIEDLTKKADPGTNCLIQNKHGDIVPYAKAYPQETAEVERIMTIQKPVALLWIDNPTEIKPEILENIHNLRLRELERRNCKKK